MYPYQRTPIGNPYISPVSRGYLWVSYPQESLLVEHNKNHSSKGYTRLDVPFQSRTMPRPLAGDSTTSPSTRTDAPVP